MKDLSKKQVLNLSGANALAYYHQKRVKEEEKKYKKAADIHSKGKSNNKNKSKSNKKK